MQLIKIKIKRSSNDAKVKHLQLSDGRNWWRQMKRSTTHEAIQPQILISK